jgi:hypothetical protein
MVDVFNSLSSEEVTRVCILTNLVSMLRQAKISSSFFSNFTDRKSITRYTVDMDVMVISTWTRVVHRFVDGFY